MGFEYYKTFLIIGAMDGINYDNLNELISDRKDITVIFVEPVPYQFKKLKENMKGVPYKVHFENEIISDKEEIVKLTYVNESSLNKYEDWYQGCSCIVENDIPLNPFINQIQVKSDLAYIVKKTTTIRKILNKYGLSEVDYVQIDTEGYDERIVKSVDFNFKLLKFEKIYLSEEFTKYLKENEKEFGVVFTQNDVYCNRIR